MLIDKYLAGLFKAMEERGDPDESDDLKAAFGASGEDIARLLNAYPDCPQTLIELLNRIDGTYWRMYGDREIAVAVLASMDNEYPHYLLSAAQMADDKDETDTIADIYGEDAADWLEIDKAINTYNPIGNWLHFTDCVNNGGTSRLYIDFDPAPGGVKGQIIEYVHDPDQYTVIADSFDAYLKGIIAKGYPFLEEE